MIRRVGQSLTVSVNQSSNPVPVMLNKGCSINQLQSTFYMYMYSPSSSTAVNARMFFARTKQTQQTQQR